MSPHSVRSADSVQNHIAKVPLRLVAERGAGHVITADVVRTVGITRAAMARHGPTESGLWRWATAARFATARDNAAGS
jgi:hypothetical protein